MGHRVYARRIESLATGAKLTDANHTFNVGGRRLRSAFISLGAGQGPCKAGAILFQETGNLNGGELGEKQWIRSPLAGGGHGENWSWHGDIPFSTDAAIRIFLSNDTGSTVIWTATWVTDP